MTAAQIIIVIVSAFLLLAIGFMAEDWDKKATFFGKMIRLFQMFNLVFILSIEVPFFITYNNHFQVLEDAKKEYLKHDNGTYEPVYDTLYRKIPIK
jgi:hypothetical protein